MADWWDVGDFNLGGGDTGSVDTGGFNLGMDTSFDWGSLGTPSWADAGQFNINWPSGGNWWDSGDFNIGPTNIPEMQSGWPGGIYSAGGWTAPSGGPQDTGGGIDWGKGLQNAANVFGTVGGPAAKIWDAYNAYTRTQQMGDYNKAVQDYYTKRQESEAAYNKAFQDYLGRRAAWEEGLAGAMGEAGGGFGEAMGEFQNQMAGWQEKIGGAMDEAKMVMGRFITASNPLLGQSQELLQSGVAALARGEEPEAWQPILNDMKQRGTAVGMQALISAGMSPEAARAAVLPKVTQDAQAIVQKLATDMITQGVAIGAQGMQGLQGAGTMASAMGQIGAQGAQVSAATMSPLVQQYMGMLQAMSGLFGGGFPSMPGGASTPPPMPQA